MRSYHWGMIVFIFIVGYLAAIWFPGPGQKLRSATGL